MPHVRLGKDALCDSKAIDAARLALDRFRSPQPLWL